MSTTYWWEIEGEDSELCGEEFFTELEDGTYEDHANYVKELFPDEDVVCYGRISEEEAEMMGLDTY